MDPSDLLGDLSNLVQVSDLGFNSRTNSVSQSFERNLAEASYRIQRQQLHREDIRDLMDLTVGRMDLYHVVGTLLLTFCITWYTENGIVASPLPKWFATLFLISNFCAVGYLMFSVWLAMHASIVAHSVGVRLLTSFARLSIPSKADLEKMRTRIYPFLQSFLDLGARLLSSAPDSVAAGASTHRFDSTGDLPRRRMSSASDLPRRKMSVGTLGRTFSRQVSEYSERPRSRSAAALSSKDGGEADEAGRGGSNAGDDDTEHFLRFLQEQRRWLSYDAYARVCMTLGMNQMLQALAYYTQGVLWNSSPVAANTSFFAIEFLGLLLMKLDVSVEDAAGSFDLAALVLFYLTPPVLASVLMWTYFAYPDAVHSGALSLCAAICFLLHACWMIYILRALQPPSPPQEGIQQGHAVLPPRFRVVRYLNVVEVQQRRIAEAVRHDRAQERAQAAAEARHALEDMMREVMNRESESDLVGTSQRQSQELMAAHERLDGLVEELRGACAGRDLEAREELERGERAVNRFAVWAQAPEILATLEGLRAASQEESLRETDLLVIEARYQAFLQQCEDLDLGICAPQLERGASAAASDAGSLGESPLPRPPPTRQALALAEEERLDAQAAGWLSFPPSACGGVAQGGAAPGLDAVAEGRPPRLALAPSYETKITEWSAAAQYVCQENKADQFEDGGDGSPIVQGSSQAVTASFPNAEEEPAAPAPALIPARSSPPEQLPGLLFRWLTLGIAFWWCVAAGIHISTVMYDTGLLEHPMENWTYQLGDAELGGPIRPPTTHASESTHVHVSARWPEPASFFHVKTLHCSETHVWVGTKFALYEAARLSPGHVGNFSEVVDTPLAAQLCEEGGAQGLQGACSTLRKPSVLGAWRLSQAAAGAGASTREADGEAVPVPLSWRVLAGTWISLRGAGREARIAAWDGAAVLMASLRRDGDDAAAAAAEEKKASSWAMHTRFEVDPRTAHCERGAGLERCLGCRKRGYADVLALQVGSGGRTLAVLHSNGAFLDGWDLTSNTLLGRWSLGGNFSAMCHDNKHVLLARQDPSGPQLEALPLPKAMRQRPVDAHHSGGAGQSPSGQEPEPSSLLQVGRRTAASTRSGARLRVVGAARRLGGDAASGGGSLRAE